jgi:hypothetical protein
MHLVRLAPLPKTRSTSGSRRGLVGRLLAAVPVGMTVAVLHERAPTQAGKRCRRRCKAQVAPCRAVIAEACAGPGSDPECAERLLPCCDPLATCDAGAAFQCIAANSG